jgi:tRNA U34 5-methylaminomethyl-2-thiouridine-forming methyltransferase MnmC
MVDGPEAVEGELAIRTGADGSFSLWSAAFQEGFHSGRGALREARETFLRPSQLDRFPPGSQLRLVEVCVGTGGNMAPLLEACAARELALEWWGLELDPRPLRLALATEAFRRPWQPSTLWVLERLLEDGHWREEGFTGHLLWGDARRTLGELLQQRRGQLDLIWHDAFSPRRCPQLWTVEVLGMEAKLLAPQGRWISFSSAAAVRETLRRVGLHPVALAIPEGPVAAARGTLWSGGTMASPRPLAKGPPGIRPATEESPNAMPCWRELSPMERDHLASAAGEPYRDPSGSADAATILASRQAAQARALASGSRVSSGAWRRRWGVERGREGAGA